MKRGAWKWAIGLALGMSQGIVLEPCVSLAQSVHIVKKVGEAQWTVSFSRKHDPTVFELSGSYATLTEANKEAERLKKWSNEMTAGSDLRLAVIQIEGEQSPAKEPDGVAGTEVEVLDLAAKTSTATSAVNRSARTVENGPAGITIERSAGATTNEFGEEVSRAYQRAKALAGDLKHVVEQQVDRSFGKAKSVAETGRASDGATLVMRDDGPKTTKPATPSLSVNSKQKDSTLRYEKTLPGGIQVSKAEDGTTAWTYPSGEISYRMPDGKESYRLPDGTTGFKQADGAIKFRRPDGTEYSKSASEITWVKPASPSESSTPLANSASVPSQEQARPHVHYHSPFQGNYSPGDVSYSHRNQSSPPPPAQRYQQFTRQWGSSINQANQINAQSRARRQQQSQSLNNYGNQIRSQMGNSGSRSGGGLIFNDNVPRR